MSIEMIDKMMMRIAWLLPRRLVYWCTIRLTSAATVGTFAETIPGDLRVFEALERWQKRV